MNGRSAAKNSRGEREKSKESFLIAKGEFKRINGNIYILKGENQIRIKEVKRRYE